MANDSGWNPEIVFEEGPTVWLVLAEQQSGSDCIYGVFESKVLADDHAATLGEGFEVVPEAIRNGPVEI